MSIDELKHFARSAWYQRFLGSGAYYSDLERMLGRISKIEDWYEEFMAMGRHHESLGDKALGEGKETTAGEAYFTASMYYQWSHNHMQSPSIEKKREANSKSVQSFMKAAPYITPPAERIEISFENTTLPAYLRLPIGVKKAPCMIQIDGWDATKEENKTVSDAFLKRGVATLSFDGPGQGEMAYRVSMRFDYEKATSAVVDYLQKRPEIDPNRIGVTGTVLGGYYAVRSAAHDDRLKVCVWLGGEYDLSQWDEHPVMHQRIFAFNMGAKTLAEAREMAKKITLQGVVQKVKCPLLLVHGKAGSHANLSLVSHKHAERVAAEAKCETNLVLLENANHTGGNIPYVTTPLITDWVKNRL